VRMWGSCAPTLDANVCVHATVRMRLSTKDAHGGLVLARASAGVCAWRGGSSVCAYAHEQRVAGRACACAYARAELRNYRRGLSIRISFRSRGNSSFAWGRRLHCGQTQFGLYGSTRLAILLLSDDGPLDQRIWERCGEVAWRSRRHRQVKGTLVWSDSGAPPGAVSGQPDFSTDA
jgi:hypothetical protein